MIPALRVERTEGAKAVPGDMLSPSQVSSLMDCAYRWHVRHKLHIPELPSSNQILGREVHAALAAMNKNVIPRLTFRFRASWRCIGKRPALFADPPDGLRRPTRDRTVLARNHLTLRPCHSAQHTTERERIATTGWVRGSLAKSIIWTWQRLCSA